MVFGYDFIREALRYPLSLSILNVLDGCRMFTYFHKELSSIKPGISKHFIHNFKCR